MTWKTKLPVFLLILFLAACGGSATEESSRDMAAPAPAEMPAAESYAYDEGGVAFSAATGQTANTADSQTTLPQERLIIRTADLSIVVADTDEAMAAIARLAETNDGWVVSSSVYQYSETAKTGDITIRVPSAGFVSATEAIKGLATEVRQESVSGQDVTEEYVDLTARLGNLEATADRVRTFLDETKTVEEALAVNQELSRLEGEIESIKGRMKYLNESASFSTIAVHLTPDELNQPIEIGGWQPQGIARDALQSLITAVQFLISVLIWLIIFLLPLVLLVGVPLWLVVRWWRRRRSARRHQTPVDGEQAAES
ncbi:MAG: DUF4349 domain-containing protein [Anaerolineales bacterium]|nr:DUF4349 domain-containing protein [Anaerolineales bacterium]